MKRSRVVWSSSADPAMLTGRYGLSRRPPSRGALRRAARTGVLLILLVVMRLVGHPRWRAAVIGAALTVTGLVLRNVAGEIILLPGLLTLGLSPFLPGESREHQARQGRLRRELAAYSTPAERRDLEAILARYPESETSELRALLASQPLTPARPHIPGMGQY